MPARAASPPGFDAAGWRACLTTNGAPGAGTSGAGGPTTGQAPPRLLPPFRAPCTELVLAAGRQAVELAGGAKVCLLRIIDDHSRFILGTRVAPGENSADAWTLFCGCAARHGPPAMLLTDNSLAFNARKVSGGMGTFEAQVRSMGTLPVASSAGHPQTCGKKERDWQPLIRWLTARPPAPTPATCNASSTPTTCSSTPTAHTKASTPTRLPPSGTPPPPRPPPAPPHHQGQTDHPPHRHAQRACQPRRGQRHLHRPILDRHHRHRRTRRPRRRHPAQHRGHRPAQDRPHTSLPEPQHLETRSVRKVLTHRVRNVLSHDSGRSDHLRTHGGNGIRVGGGRHRSPEVVVSTCVRRRGPGPHRRARPAARRRSQERAADRLPPAAADPADVERLVHALTEVKDEVRFCRALRQRRRGASGAGSAATRAAT